MEGGRGGEEQEGCIDNNLAWSSQFVIISLSLAVVFDDDAAAADDIADSLNRNASSHKKRIELACACNSLRMYNLSTKQLDDAINCRRDGEAGEDVGDKDDDDVGDASATTDGVNLSSL